MTASIQDLNIKKENNKSMESSSFLELKRQAYLEAIEELKQEFSGKPDVLLRLESYDIEKNLLTQ